MRPSATRRPRTAQELFERDAERRGNGLLGRRSLAHQIRQVVILLAVLLSGQQAELRPDVRATRELVVIGGRETTGLRIEQRWKIDASAVTGPLMVIDDSEKHRGHGGYNPAGESHFTLLIESPDFTGKSRVERQRMVHAALGELVGNRVHALSIKAKAPGE